MSYSTNRVMVIEQIETYDMTQIGINANTKEKVSSGSIFVRKVTKFATTLFLFFTIGFSIGYLFYKGKECFAK